MKYNKLTFLENAGKAKDGHKLWKCKCDCGDIYVGQASRIKSGRAIQCKNCSLKQCSKTNSKHGMKHSLEYSSWMAMKSRCLNKKSKDYAKYGAVGITIYEPWINSFENFFEYMGKKQKGESIDRIDNSKGYFPNNVRWATSKQQQRNRTNSLWIDWKGVKTHISDVAKELGISNGAAHLRFKRGKLYE